jgi:hypothetical protein
MESLWILPKKLRKFITWEKSKTINVHKISSCVIRCLCCYLLYHVHGVTAFIKATKSFVGLSYTKGKVTDAKILRHKQEGKYTSKVEDVLVLRIEEASDEFTFLQ